MGITGVLVDDTAAGVAAAVDEAEDAGAGVAATVVLGCAIGDDGKPRADDGGVVEDAIERSLNRRRIQSTAS